jgi:hypothetical protein
MAIGVQPTLSGLNQQAGQVILNARNALQAILYFDLYLQSLGQAQLVTLGYSSDDATALLTMFTNLASVANMCNGAPYAGPALPFDFLTSTAPAWGGN